MANDNNNINELVVDDDPTVELELPIFRNSGHESSFKTFDANEHKGKSRSTSTVTELTAELRSRQETIDRLQFDLRQLEAKWLGLEAEVNAREGQGSALHSDLAEAQENTRRKERLLKLRDRKIKTLKAEIRERDGEQRKLSSRCDDLQIALDRATRFEIDINSTQISGQTSSSNELQARVERSNEYADSMRRQLQDLMEAQSSAEREIDHLSTALETANRKTLDLTDIQASLTADIDELTEQLNNIQRRHDEEIRILRFELTAAESTVADSDNINTQLASELVDVQGFKNELENKFEISAEESASRIEALRKEKTKIESSKKILEQKLTAKSEAITALLSELAKKSEQIEAIRNVDERIPDIDFPILKHPVGEIAASDERVSRVLVGSVDGQTLSFPLFKDRLTIGRTKDNDVQLDAAYISRRHAIIQTDDAEVRIIDWGSKNGIRVNSKRIDEHSLHHGDEIMIGNARFRYEEHKQKNT
jgi:chromosome segregation ATPase